MSKLPANICTKRDGLGRIRGYSIYVKQKGKLVYAGQFGKDQLAEAIAAKQAIEDGKATVHTFLKSSKQKSEILASGARRRSSAVIQ